MTGVELQKHLMSSGLFKDENVYMVEVDDSGKIFNRVPSYYKMRVPMVGLLEIKVYYMKYKKEKHIDIKFSHIHLALDNLKTFKLKDLDLTTLCNELRKIIGYDQRFVEWSTKYLRDYKINSLYEE